MSVLILLLPWIGAVIGLILSWKFTFAVVVPFIPADEKSAKLIGLVLWFFVFAGIGLQFGFIAGGLILAGLLMQPLPAF